MLAAASASAGHPAVAALIGMAAAALAAVIVIMAWNVHAREIRLAEHLASRQFIVTAEAAAAGRAPDAGGSESLIEELDGVPAPPAAPRVIIDGPDIVATGAQARYSVRAESPAAGSRSDVTWAVIGGSFSQSDDPAHPGELLLTPDRPGTLTITAAVPGERRGTKSATAVAAAPVAAPPFMLRLFLQGWGLVVIAVLIVGFAGALGALGNFAASDYVALVSPLAALLGVVAFARGPGEAGNRDGHGRAGPQS
jgi:hypothetical protein